MMSESANTGEAVSTYAATETLNPNEVLSGIPLDGADTAGAYITFETIGGSTVVSIDADGVGPGEPVPVITLANVTGKTLQELLNDLSL